MTELQERCLTICRSCPFKARWCVDEQPCLCTADGADIRDHAKEMHCPQNMYPTSPPQPMNLVHGVAGIAKAITGTGGADAQTVQKRVAICTECEHNVLSLGLIHRCELCGCLTWAKTRNLEEKCPADKW